MLLLQILVQKLLKPLLYIGKPNFWLSKTSHTAFSFNHAFKAISITYWK